MNMMIYEEGWKEKGHDHDNFKTIHFKGRGEMKVSIIMMIYEGGWKEKGHDHDGFKTIYVMGGLK